MNLYVIRDKLAETTLNVWEAPTDASAKRAYVEGLKDRSPDEYQLLRIGTIDHATCRLTVENVPVEVN